MKLGKRYLKLSLTIVCLCVLALITVDLLNIKVPAKCYQYYDDVGLCAPIFHPYFWVHWSNIEYKWQEIELW